MNRIETVPNRWLLYHAESDCLFEVFDKDEMQECLADGYTDDVTGIEELEDRFRNEQE